MSWPQITRIFADLDTKKKCLKTLFSSFYGLKKLKQAQDCTFAPAFCFTSCRIQTTDFSQ